MTIMTQQRRDGPPISGRIGSWMLAPLGLVVAAFVAFSLWPYLTLDPSRSRIVPPVGVPAYYPVLVAHVCFGSIAILTCALQMWPWLRRRSIRAHRAIGRIYVFAGVMPAGIAGLAIGAVSPFGPVIRASNVLLAVVWLFVTTSGYRAGRRGRLVEHRRWMVRSFALTLSVISNRIWAVVAVVALLPQLETTFGGNEALFAQTIAGMSGWLGWVLPLLFVEWRLEREVTRSSRTAVNAAV